LRGSKTSGGSNKTSQVKKGKQIQNVNWTLPWLDKTKGKRGFSTLKAAKQVVKGRI